MVSLNTILAIGGLGAAYIIFKNLGGAAGIGSSIGSGFATFGSSLTKSLNFAPDFQNPLNRGVPTGYRVDPTETRTYEEYIEEYENPLKEEMKTEDEPFIAFKFNEAYGDTTPTTKTSFAGQGLISSGYQAPNYSTAGAGYSADSFFANDSPKPVFSGVATSSKKSTLSDLTGGLLG